MAGPNLNTPPELAAYLETVRQRQQVSNTWPADYLYHPVDGGRLTVSVRDAQGQVQNYSVWLKRDQPGGAFNSFVLLNTQAQFDNLYTSRPSADRANTVSYGDKKAWVNATTGEVRQANVSEVYYIPGSGKIVPEQNGLDYAWSQSGEFVDPFDAERMRTRHQARIDRNEIPKGTPLTQEGKGELVRVRRAFVNSDLIRDGIVSAADLKTDLRSQGFAYDIPGTLVQGADSQKKAAAEQVMIAGLSKARDALNAAPAATASAAALQGSPKVSVYQIPAAAAATPATPQATGSTVLNPASFMAEVQKLSLVTPADITAAKDDKTQMRAASRAISDLDRMLGSDPKAQKPETQARILDALKASPGQRDILADYVRKKIADPSLAMNEHSGMVTGRMLGMRPALGAVENIQPKFQSAAGGSETVAPKNLATLNLLPTKTDIVEDYNRAQEVLDMIRRSATPSESAQNKLPAAQITQVIAAYRAAGYEGYAKVMEDMNRTAASDPTMEYAKAAVALHSAYVGTYDKRQQVQVQEDFQRARERALEHLKVDYDKIRQQIPDILKRSGIDPATVTEPQRDEIMRQVRESINRTADQLNAITPERVRDIERTINTRIEQAVISAAANKLGNVEERVTNARAGAQAEYDARSQAFIEQLRAMPADQREKICANSGNNPLVQAACKP